jgi:hypothetical protein
VRACVVHGMQRMHAHPSYAHAHAQQVKYVLSNLLDWREDEMRDGEELGQWLPLADFLPVSSSSPASDSSSSPSPIPAPSSSSSSAHHWPRSQPPVPSATMWSTHAASSAAVEEARGHHQHMPATNHQPPPAQHHSHQHHQQTYYDQTAAPMASPSLSDFSYPPPSTSPWHDHFL